MANLANSSRTLCPGCGSEQIEAHEASGAMVCTECGVILEENAIVSAVEFVEGQGGASSMYVYIFFVLNDSMNGW